MTQLRRLTRVGIEGALGFLAQAREDPDIALKGPPEDLLFGREYSELSGHDVCVERRTLATRRDAAAHIRPRVNPVRRAMVDDMRSWSWLGMYHFVDIVGATDPPKVSRLDEAFVVPPSSRAHQRRYRHYLWGAWRLYEQHREDAAFLLDDQLTSWPDLAERLFGSVRAFNSPGVMILMRRLYVRRDGTRKRSYTKGPGSLRHLMAVLRQLERTYDVYGMHEDALLAILPKPFQQWAKIGAT